MTSSQPPIKLLIADDHRLITDGIYSLLENEWPIEKIFTVNNGKDAVSTVLSQEIDCVIMDINMPGLNGLEATKMIKKAKPNVKIIIISMMSDVAIVTKMLRVGAEGFMNKNSDKKEILLAINKVMNGEKYISPEINSNLINQIAKSQIQIEETEKVLSSREIEIIKLIAEGNTNKEIAEKLFLSTLTVNTHRKNILSKLQIKNTASLIKFAIESKLI